MKIQRAVDEIDADDAQGLLFLQILFVPEPDMDDDLRRLAARLGLKTNAQPAVRVVVPRITARHHRVGKDKKPGRRPAFFPQPFQQQPVFVIEHRFQALAADVTIGVAVNGVADGHVVGGNGFGNRAGGAAHAEKPARHLLPGADFGKRAVFGRVQVDLERLLMRA